MNNQHQELMLAYEAMNKGQYEKAHVMFNQLALDGQSKALLYLGWMHEQGLGCSVDLSKAESFYKRLIELDEADTDASYYYAALKSRQGSSNELIVAYEAMNKGQYEKAHVMFNQLALDGQSKALLYLGWMHEQGLGCSVDLSKAESFYKRLIELDEADTDASYYYASLKFRQGSSSDALPHFIKSAKSGNPSAAYWAFIILNNEVELTNSKEMALYYLTTSAEQGHVYAKRALAKKYLLEANTLYEKIKCRWDYLVAWIKGLFFILRNSNDLRSR